MKQLLEKRWAANTLAVCVGVVLYLILTNIGKASTLVQLLSPVVTGAVLAYLFNPLMVFLETRLLSGIPKESLRHTLAAVITVVCIVLIVVLLAAALVPSLVESISGLIANRDLYIAAIEEWFNAFVESPMGKSMNLSSFSEMFNQLLSTALGSVAENMGTILNASASIGSSLFNGVIGFIICIYLLVGKKGIVDGVDQFRRNLFTPESYRKHTEFWSKCHKIFIQYIGCDVLDGLIIGGANAVFMLIMKMPYTALVSLVVGATNLLPTFGPIIGAVVGAFILVLNNPLNALWFLIFTVVLQFFDGYILKPRLFSNSFGIPAVWTLLSIVIGGKFWGVAGILLAIPVVAVLLMVYRDMLLPYLKERAKEGEKEQKNSQSKSVLAKDGKR